tara:strand:- start:13161 stop:13376 length:216 start_codon:yes stop_codon:yes gene_type:complete
MWSELLISGSIPLLSVGIYKFGRWCEHQQLKENIWKLEELNRRESQERADELNNLIQKHKDLLALYQNKKK